MAFVFSGNAETQKAENYIPQTALSDCGWADGMNCDDYALGAYYGYLSGKPGDQDGANAIYEGAFDDCMAGGGHSSHTVVVGGTDTGLKQ